MKRDFSFPQYLLSKQSVDDRALNKDVFNALRQHLPQDPLCIIEIGAGIGTMPVRLIRWNTLHQAEYVLVDEMSANLDFARDWLQQWSDGFGLKVEKRGTEELRLFDHARDIHIHFQCADVFDFIHGRPIPADVLIANAFLDLLPLPSGLQEILSLTKNLAWLTINFDGGTTFEPVIDTALDSIIEQLYHHSMDARPSGGDSRSGRHLFGHLSELNHEILSAGASDWVVFPVNKRYPADEAYFLHCILHFMEITLTGNADLDVAQFEAWLAQRRTQIQRGELIYIAHQMDFLVKR